MAELREYQRVQELARCTMDFIKREIRPGMPLPMVRTLCEQKLLELGADSFWYWDVGAFVFSAGTRRCPCRGRIM